MKSTEADMTEGRISSELIRFAIPMAIGLLFQQLYNSVDTFVVGRFVSTSALAAVGSVSPIINTLVGFCNGIATGAGIVISQCYGAHDDRRLRQVIDTTCILTVLLAVFSTAAGVLIVEPMLHLMNTPNSVFNEALIYLRIYFEGVSGLLIYNMGAGILRAVGDSRKPLYFLVFSAVLNTVMDILFVVVFHLGVAGVAYATILAQFCSAVLIVLTLSRVDGPYALHLKELRPTRHEVRVILVYGLPSGIQQAITSFSNVFVQSYINAFGSACMAGWSMFGKLDAFTLIPMQSITMASSTFIGQNYGAGRLSRARQGVRTAQLMSFSITACLIAALMSCSSVFLGIFSQDAEAIAYGTRFTLLCTPFYLVCCFYDIYAGALRGTGHATSPTVAMLCSFVVFRQIYLFITAKLHAGFVAVALAYPMGWCLCGVLLTILYRRSALALAKQPKEENIP